MLCDDECENVAYVLWNCPVYIKFYGRAFAFRDLSFHNFFL